ncbi:MAG: signal peptidase I, partial [Cellulomonadaceae bacterium]|nr:signal peptidase I [Cellulomonadaceae bacterium]
TLITVFTAVGLLPQDSGEHLVKRAIGVPGDRVVCCDALGQIMVNGTSINEHLYVRPGSIPSQVVFDVTVPPEMLFVMGDNRQNSQDSRYNLDKPYGGFVPLDNVVGTAFAIVWPLNHATWLRNPGSVFAPVP